ncbi:hypothetical protein ABZS89_39275, partial [Streptomyces sp. NPDC005407]
MVAQASFIAALMFYMGVIYTSAYYGHFHLSPFFLGFGFAEFVLQSLHLMTFPVLVAVVLLIAVAISGRRPRQALPGGADVLGHACAFGLCGSQAQGRDVDALRRVLLG